MRFVKEGREAFLSQIEGGYVQLVYGTERGTVIEGYRDWQDAIRFMPFVPRWSGELGEFDLFELWEFYEDEVDKVEYPDFEGWIRDMQRSALLFRQ